LQDLRNATWPRNSDAGFRGRPPGGPSVHPAPGLPSEDAPPPRVPSSRGSSLCRTSGSCHEDGGSRGDYVSAGGSMCRGRQLETFRARDGRVCLSSALSDVMKSLRSSCRSQGGPKSGASDPKHHSQITFESRRREGSPAPCAGSRPSSSASRWRPGDEATKEGRTR